MSQKQDILTIFMTLCFCYVDAWDGDDDLFKSLNIGNSNSSNVRPLSGSLKPASRSPSTSTIGTLPPQPSSTTTTGSGFVRKEEKMAEMARKREERRLRMAEAKEKKSQTTTLGARKI